VCVCVCVGESESIDDIPSVSHTAKTLRYTHTAPRFGDGQPQKDVGGQRGERRGEIEERREEEITKEGGGGGGKKL